MLSLVTRNPRALRVLLGLVPMLAGAVAAEAKTLVYCTEADPGVISPAIVTSTTGVNASQPMFDTLVDFKPGGGDIIPALAESWTVSSDGREYVFHLRRGVKFHANAAFTPTRDFDADDVLFSFERQWRDGNPYHHTPGASFSYFDDMDMAGLLTSIDRIDDHTVRFRLAHAEAPFLADLAMAFAMIGSKEYADAMLRAGTPERFDAEPVGTGPFSFQSYRKDVAVRYRAFADYWNGRPKLDELVFLVTPNASMRSSKLESGDCQVASFPNPVDAARIEADPNLQLVRQAGLNIGYLALNVGKAPLGDVRIRRAIASAVDRETIVRTVYGRAGTVAKNPIPPSLWSYNDSIQAYPYDPDAAQRLMAEAGYPDGFETELWYIPINRPYSGDSKRVAEMIADDLARIGIKVRLTSAPWADYRKALMAGQAPLALYGWVSDNGDPDNFLDLLLGCHDGEPLANNVAKWCDPEYDRLIQTAKLTSDRGERARLYGQAQVIFHRQLPWLPIAHALVMSGVRKDVRGFTLDPFGRFFFDKVDIAEGRAAFPASGD